MVKVTNRYIFLCKRNRHFCYQGSYYFQIRGRSDFSFSELTGRSGLQQREVGRLLREVNGDYLKHCFETPLKLPCLNLVNSFKTLRSDYYWGFIYS